MKGTRNSGEGHGAHKDRHVLVETGKEIKKGKKGNLFNEANMMQ